VHAAATQTGVDTLAMLPATGVRSTEIVATTGGAPGGGRRVDGDHGLYRRRGSPSSDRYHGHRGVQAVVMDIVLSPWRGRSRRQTGRERTRTGRGADSISVYFLLVFPLHALLYIPV
jgi:hypothetical protein